MPIRINLLAEAIAEEDLRRRDPVKHAIYIGAFLVALSLVWFSAIWTTYLVTKQSLNHTLAEIQTRTNDYAQVKTNLKKIGDIQQRLDALDQYTAARFLQGNLLNAMQQVYVPNVQLTRLRLDQTYTAGPAVPAKTNSSGGVVPGRPPAVTEHIMMFVDAKDFSPSAGDQVNHFRDAIARQEFFKNVINPTNGIRLAGAPSALQTPPDGKSYVMFMLECRFSERNP